MKFQIKANNITKQKGFSLVEILIDSMGFIEEYWGYPSGYNGKCQ
jgi:hypothetical protein